MLEMISDELIQLLTGLATVGGIFLAGLIVGTRIGREMR